MTSTLPAMARSVIRPETPRNAIRYYVWQQNGMLHQLCQIESPDVLAGKIGHGRSWLQNVLSGRKPILYHDMRKMCKVLAELHGAGATWDTRDLFPDYQTTTMGPTLFRTVTKHAKGSHRVTVPAAVFAVGAKVEVRPMESKQ